ncbi:trigger factor [Roseburia sp. 1XD42-69]|uniref:trigger factor n=1 Tax=Roseburia sp. 1XD42-69 TaxID=2320088 RepID=UPI000EA03551|nr:trigger factor [Roseburia sp. 1XD42-69]RKJ68387.1 trigger factor [Roseburia sp. 1XD42-69]
MKKCYLNLAAFVCCASLLTGCGKDSSATEEAISSTEADFSEALNYDPADYVKLGDYKKLKVQYPLPYVSDEDMQMYIYDLMDEATEYRETEDAAKSGDYVKIDFTGTIDGKEFEGGSASGYEFILGQGEFFDDFEKNVIGLKKGEDVSFQMTFPEDYFDELKGKTADFKVTLQSVSQVIQPEYTDEFVAKNTEYSSIEEYEEAIREELIVEAQQASEDEAGSSALAQAVENAKIEGYPQALYDYTYQDTREICEGTAQMFGLEIDEVIQDYYGAENLEEAVLDAVNETMVIQAIAKKEKLEISEKDFEKEAENLSAEYGYETLEEFEEDYSRTELELILVREKVLDFLYESSELEEVSQEEYYGSDEFFIEGTESTEWILEEDEE